MIKLSATNNGNVAKVDAEGVLMVGLDGFTLEDLSKLYPGVNIGLHVLDGDKWVPVTIEDIKKGMK